MSKTTCPACKNEIETAEFCPLCEFPFNGSEIEKAKHIGRFINKKGVIVDSKDSLKTSRNFVLAAAGFYALSFILNIDIFLNNMIYLFVELGVIITLVTCAMLIKKQPLVFLGIPLALLLFIYTIQYLADERTLMQGIIFKILIIGSLIYSIYLNKSSNNFKKKFNV
jgi:hypothetical protein